MGAYLSEPVTEKISSDKHNERLAVGASSMQGWRVSQEDSHNCELDFDTNTALFSVYDGHGGAEVAVYCSLNLPQIIKETESYKNGNMAQALEDAFLKIDDTLITKPVLEELKRLAGDTGHQSDEGDEDEIDNLHAEANMPIDQLLAKYRTNSNPHVKYLNQENRGRFLRPSEQDMPGPSTNCQDSSAPSSSTSGITDSGDCLANGGLNSIPTLTNGEPSSKDKILENLKISKAQVMATCSKILAPILSRAAKPSSLKDGSTDSEESDDDDDFDGPKSTTDDDDDDDEEEHENEQESSQDDDDDEEEEEEEEDDNENVLEEESYVIGEKEEPGFDSGCTAVVALLRNDQLFVANAGDSRCVVCRNGKAIEMSHDHKPEDEIEKKRIEAAGGNVTPDGRVNGGLNLSRAIGDHSYKKNTNLDAKDQMISALPDIRTLAIDSQQDEFMVIACDGIWNFMNSQQVVDFVRERLVPERDKLSSICEELFDKCLSPSTAGDGTGCDNMTCIIVKFDHFERSSNKVTRKRSSDVDDTLEKKKAKTAQVTE